MCSEAHICVQCRPGTCCLLFSVSFFLTSAQVTPLKPPLGKYQLFVSSWFTSSCVFSGLPQGSWGQRIPSDTHPSPLTAEQGGGGRGTMPLALWSSLFCQRTVQLQLQQLTKTYQFSKCLPTVHPGNAANVIAIRVAQSSIIFQYSNLANNLLFVLPAFECYVLLDVE